MDAQRNLTVLAESWHACTRCGICEIRPSNNIYFGFGAPSPKYLIVGGVPTDTDEKFSSLFAGEPGELLFSILERCKIDIAEECYFTYALSCRPTVTIPATETDKEKVETREPTKEEYIACRPRLNEILYQTDPRAIITLGEVATKAVIRGRLRKFLDAVGKQYIAMLPRREPGDKNVEGRSRHFDIPYPVFASPDMGTILNNPSTADHGPLQVAIRTIERARVYTDFVIRSELETMQKKE